jgi:hypothetical protein
MAGKDFSSRCRLTLGKRLEKRAEDSRRMQTGRFSIADGGPGPMVKYSKYVTVLFPHLIH